MQVGISSEREALELIFQKFEMNPTHYRSKVDLHFDIANKARSKISSGEDVNLADIVSMFDSLRLHKLVEEWEDLQEAQRDTYSPKTLFVSTSSKMLFRKRVEVNSSNKIVVYSDSGQSIPIGKLSSGEKQLLIFLGECLLQERQPFIFLADDPELSLHVEWQEELVPNLLKVNPNAQVLFATHSPDIVNSYQNNVTRMEEVIE